MNDLSLHMFGSLLGGVGLFLLGMRLMTDGLKYAAGKALKGILERSTSTPLRGIVFGAGITSLVQSSSAVTVAVIGFVNAGLMDLGHSITVIYGSNIGTTMTGWLVSLFGFHFNIKTFAVPAVGLGMLLRLVRHDSKFGAFGDVLAGFGVFFIGVDLLKTTFSGIGPNIQVASFAGDSIGALMIFIGIGFLLTLAMQSSSAAIAVILTATAGNIIPLYDAAAVVIGANVGTTSTAALSVIGATSNAKRLALGHVIFNVVTGLVALLILPFLLALLSKVEVALGLEQTPTTLLALFHTAFNILGVMLLYPFTGRLVRFLSRFARTRDEDESVPRHLDRNIVGTPVLAIQALAMELKRISEIARRMARGAISAEVAPGPRLKMDKVIIDKLIIAVGDFSNLLMRNNIPADLDDFVASALRVSGYYNDVAEIAVDLAEILSALRSIDDTYLASEIIHFKKMVVKFLDRADSRNDDYSASECKELLEGIKDEYRELKSRLLRATSKGMLSAAQLVQYLEIIGRIRRIAEQSEKGARFISEMRLPDKIVGEEPEPIEK